MRASLVPAGRTRIHGPLPRASLPPLIFVLGSLLALAALPILGNRYIDKYRIELRELTDPARDLMTESQSALALGGAALRDFLNTRDPLYLDRYRQAMARELAAYRALAPIAAQLNGEVEQRYDVLRIAETNWHDRVEALLRAQQREPHSLAGILANEELFEQTLLASASLDGALARAAAVRRDTIDHAERRLLALTLILASLALIAAVVVARLVTNMRAFARTAERDRRELEQVLDSRARMTRGITHDLKNPLGVIIGHAELMTEGVRGQLTPDQLESISRINSAATSMLGLIDTLLELERAEAGQISIERRPVDVGELVTEVAENHRAEIEQAGLDLELFLADDLGRVETDPARVVQVLGNLLSNAVKYTPSGFVRIRATARDSGPPGPAIRGTGRWIAIDVEDSGRGIPAQQQHLIFEEFSRLNADAAPGVGLGLAISRRIARLLGGEITFTSQEGKGSTFTFWLPA